MRLQTKKTIMIRDKVLGGENPLICIPLTAKDELSLEREMGKAMDLSHDVIEWRIDYFDKIYDIHHINNTL